MMKVLKVVAAIGLLAVVVPNLLPGRIPMQDEFEAAHDHDLGQPDHLKNYARDMFAPMPTRWVDCVRTWSSDHLFWKSSSQFTNSCDQQHRATLWVFMYVFRRFTPLHGPFDPWWWS
jgi:hypothetical protein